MNDKNTAQGGLLPPIDNADLLSYIPSEKVRLIPGNASGTVQTPEWVEKLILVELRTDMASIGGTMPQSRTLVDFYASVGVNAFWLCPIYLRQGGNGYGNVGPHRFEPAITGTEDQTRALRNIRDFVNYCHQKGIYVFFDVITWGVLHNTELERDHPDWFEGEAWGGAAFQWKNPALREWFTGICVRNILETDADGFRCDCEPFTSGYEVYGEIRARLAAKGKHVVIMSESGCDRSRTYDLEQDGVLHYAAMTRGEFYQHPVNFYADGLLDIVDSVKNGTGLGYEDGQKDPAVTGTGRYYTNCITNHDFEARNVCGSRLKIGYAAILAPFIPLWYMGDEFNADCPAGVQYFQPVRYDEAALPRNKAFLEDVKKYIRIRRTYPDLFEVWPVNHRDSNICRVSVEGGAGITAYARYAKGRAALIVPADAASAPEQTVFIPYRDCGLAAEGTCRITDLMRDTVVAEGPAAALQTFRAAVRPDEIGVYLVEKV